MKYDIQSLLALSQNSRPEIEKYRALALGRTSLPLSEWSVFPGTNSDFHLDNLVRQRKTNSSALSERSAKRSREASNLSYHSEVTSVSGPSLRPPSRQPNNPPRGNLAQTDAGFARFLKEHSSPKHQRVTAGGRIIPMDPSTPAPKMKLPLKKVDPKNCDGAANTVPRAEQHRRAQRRSTQSIEKDADTSDISKVSSLPAGVLVDHVKLACANGTPGQYVQVPNIFSSLPPPSITPTMLLRPGVTLPLGNQIPQPEQQTQEYLKVLPNYTAYGFGDQIAWLPNTTSQSLNPHNSVNSFIPASGQSSEFSAYNNLVPVVPSIINPIPSGLDTLYSTIGATGFPLSGGHVSLLNQALPFHGPTQGGIDAASIQGAAKEYEVLSAQLARLDRYMALHTWDLDPHSKKLLVEERMDLVRDLDAMRLYKEQLEAMFGQAKSDSEETQKRAGTRAPEGQLPLGGFTSNQTLQIPRFSALTPNQVPIVLPRSTLPTGFQNGLSMNEPFPTAFQWPSKGDPYSSDNGLVHGDVPAGSEAYESETLYQDERCRTTTGPDKQNVQFQATDSTDAEDGCGDGWATPTKSAPSDVSRIYRRIEEAAKRGVPIESLLQELAAVTTKFVRQVSEGRNASSSTRPKQSSKVVASSNQPGPLAAGARHILPAQPHSHAVGRLWRSEGHAQASTTSLGTTPDETDEEDEGESCSSSSSTTNSWATIRERPKQRNVAEALANGNNAEHESRPLKGNPVALEQAKPVNAQSAKLRNKIDLGPKGNMDIRKSSADSTKQGCRQLLRQYFDKQPGLNSRKSVALAVSQSVTAHAFLPPFDGAWDSPSVEGHSDPEHSGIGPSSPDPYDLESSEANTTQQSGVEWPNQKGAEDRPPPCAAEVRGFFRRIEEDERAMIREYEMREPAEWEADDEWETKLRQFHEYVA